MFALEYSLAALWRSWGVEPLAALGHSVGSRGCVRHGVFSLEDALALVAARGRLMQRLPTGGTWPRCSPAKRRSGQRSHRIGHVAMAAVNGPNGSSFPARARLYAVLRDMQAQGIKPGC